MQPGNNGQEPICSGHGPIAVADGAAADKAAAQD
jgi:hypothetical protein